MFRKFFRNLFPTVLPTEEQALKALILQTGTPFGSRVWGGAKASSDYDFFMTQQCFSIVEGLLTLHELTFESIGTYTNKLQAEKHIRFTLKNGETYDLICFDGEPRFNRFTLMCSITTAYSKIVDLSSRIDRITAFDQICFIVNNNSITLEPRLNTFIKTHFPELLI